jgi:hypothetical protein
VVDRSAYRKIVDFKWVFKIKCLAKGSGYKFTAQVVPKGYSQIQEHDYDETFALVGCFNSFHLLLPIVTTKGCEHQQLNIKATNLYSDLKEPI